MNKAKAARFQLKLLFVTMMIVSGFIVEAHATEVTMYKNANCGCCGAWATHMRDAGFSVKELPRDDMEVVKEKYGVPTTFASCHTAIVGGYVIEGHVPAADVQRLLKEQPNIVGLTAPGMPMHSPGMQTKGLKPKGYDVLAFDKQGQVKVYHRYE